MVYESINETNLTKGFGEAVRYVNTVSDGWFIFLTLISTYFILLFAIFRTERDFPESMAVAGFITFLFASLLWFAEFLSGTTMLVVTSIFILSFIIIWAIRNSVA